MGNGTYRNKLWNVNPRCIWCGVITKRPPEGKAAITEGDTATLDHVISKWHQRVNPEAEQMTVLSCADCNLERGRAHEMFWIAFYRAETAQICNPRLVRLGEILKQAMTRAA